MKLRRLPTGISTLRTIIEEDMVYIDKTMFAYDLIEAPGRYFLARPRRFGKSLFVDTLKEIFEGNRELFKGLYIHDRWDWDRTFPVIKFDFAGGVVRNVDELFVRLTYMVRSNAERLGLEIDYDTDAAGIHANLIKAAKAKYGSNVVVLIDEYDKPILDNIDDVPRAVDIKDRMKGFYSPLKEQDANLRFVFLTGVSKFSKVNIFSGINNLTDLTLDRRSATVCGYTQRDLEIDFHEHLKDVDWDMLKTWYNGYNFLGEPVYNPFDILQFIGSGLQFRNYWFETGTPSFLMKLMRTHRYFLPDLHQIDVGEESISSFELENIEPVSLLYQSGYLTILKAFSEMGESFFRLGYPNLEVKRSLNRHLINGYTEIGKDRLGYEHDTHRSLVSADLPELEKTIKRLFAAIPYRNYTRNDIADYEGYYASVLYAFFLAIGCEVVPEDVTNHGQADLTVEIDRNVYVMEIKVVPRKRAEEAENSALAQIRERNYAEKYLRSGKRVFEVGMIFDGKARNLVMFDWRRRN
jgi:hypothetical protein